MEVQRALQVHLEQCAGPNGLTIDSKSHLYGTTAAGGEYNVGVAFKFAP